MLEIVLAQQFTDSQLRDLSALLRSTVEQGASIGFLLPISENTAEQYWLGIQKQILDANAGQYCWLALDAGKVVGSVQLSRCMKENGLHRAEIQKLMVLPEQRSHGVGAKLMQNAENYAQTLGCTLLVLDTMTHSPAEAFYQNRGWTKLGDIPQYAAFPDGILGPTAVHFKEI